MDRNAAIALLEKVDEGRVAWTHNQGFEWFVSDLLPAVDVLERDRPIPDLLASCYYEVGDIHDFNNAPLAAIAAYKRSIDWKPMSGAYREVCNMCEKIGRLDEAIEYGRIAIAMDPDDDNAKSDLEEAEEALVKGVEDLLYTEGDRIWQADEHLARREPEAALSELGDGDDIDTILARARCLGALRKDSDCIAEWRRLPATRGTIDIDYRDWFFLPEALYESAELWSIMKQIHPRFGSGAFPAYDSLSAGRASSGLDWQEEKAMIIDFKLAYCSKDRAGLEAIARACPEWTEAQDAVKEFAAFGRWCRSPGSTARTRLLGIFAALAAAASVGNLTRWRMIARPTSHHVRKGLKADLFSTGADF